MYRSKNCQQLEFPDFYLPFSGHLDPENRWIALARLVPWGLAEEIYHAELCEDSGQPIVPARVALGALLIKERLKLTDRETVEVIQENPYLQFFIGLEEFTLDRPFDASLMVDFRKRFGEEGIQRMAEAIALASLQAAEPISAEPTPEGTADDNPEPPTTAQPTINHSQESSGQESNPQQTLPESAESENAASDDPTETPPNRGQLIADATCAPADIRYPTDVSLLNEAREKTEEVIDALHASRVGKAPRPRTYRVKARRAFLAFIKKKRPGNKAIRRAKKKQLGFLGRNLRAIDRLLEHPENAQPLTPLSRRQVKNLLVVREVFRQQMEMFESRSQRVDDRIVSISQPHVRPIKRGKAGRETEFGAKLSISVIDGFSFVDRLSWNNYNEGTDLVEQIETYRRRFGFYPESVHVDKIYRTRANRKFCKTHGIRMTGPPLGRPPQRVSLADKKQAATDEAIRNRVEGKFGEGKRRFGLGRVMAKLACTSTAQISLSFLVMNLEEALRRFFFAIIFLCQVLFPRLFARQVASINPPCRCKTPGHNITPRPRPAFGRQNFTRWTMSD